MRLKMAQFLMKFKIITNVCFLEIEDGVTLMYR